MRHSTIWKWVIYAAIAVLCCTVETRFLPYLRVRGVSPAFGAALTACVAMFEGGTGGAFFGLFCGALCYLDPAGGETVYMLVYMFGGYVTGVFCQELFRRTIAAALIWTLALTAVATVIYLIFAVVLARRPAAGTLFLSSLIAIGMNTAMALPVYPLVRRIALRFGSVEDV